MNESPKRIKSLVIELYKCYSLHNTEEALVLFDIGTSCVAIGNDTDRLYLTLGWEITDFCEENTIYSYMLVSSQGVKILQDLYSNIEIRNIGKHYQIVDKTTSTTQQSLDYLRMLVGHKSINYPIITTPVTIKSVGIIRETRITSLIINARSITVCIENCELIDLVQDHEWNFSHIGLALLETLSDMMEQQSAYIINLIQAEEKYLRNQRIHNTALYELFLENRNFVSPYTLVFIQVEYYYLTFDDDAIDAFTFQKGVMLYDCNVFGLRGRTVALLSRSQLETMKDTHPLIVVNRLKYTSLYKLGLKESYLNQKCNHKIAYSDVSIRKQKDGKYIISASYNGHQLPEVPILNSIGGYYCNLPSCKERSVILSSLVHHTYDRLISSYFGTCE